MAWRRFNMTRETREKLCVLLKLSNSASDVAIVAAAAALKGKADTASVCMPVLAAARVTRSERPRTDAGPTRLKSAFGYSPAQLEAAREYLTRAYE
jgi:hypothetical protein